MFTLVNLLYLTCYFQEGFLLPQAKRVWDGRSKEGYATQIEADRKAVEVGRVGAVGLEKTGYRQRHIQTNTPYYGGYYGGYVPYYGYGYGYPYGYGDFGTGLGFLGYGFGGYGPAYGKIDLPQVY